jgi:HlyD family secretion protein
VAASFQTPELFTVAPDMDKEMHIYASVDEADIGLIEGAQANKMPVQFTVDAYPHDLFEGTIYQIRRNSTTNQNVVTYPVVVRTTNPRLKLLPGMTANLSFLVETKENLLRVPSAALRFAPPLMQVHPEDRALLTVTPEKNNQDSGSRISAGQKAALARGRSQRVVWVKDGEWLRGKKITLGVTDTQFAELIEGNIAEGEELITGLDSTPR